MPDLIQDQNGVTHIISNESDELTLLCGIRPRLGWIIVTGRNDLTMCAKCEFLFEWDEEEMAMEFFQAMHDEEVYGGEDA